MTFDYDLQSAKYKIRSTQRRTIELTGWLNEIKTKTGAEESAHLHRINTSTTFINTRRKTNI